MDLDNLTYGNIPYKQIKKIKKDRAGLLKKSVEAGIISDILKNHPYPKNTSDTTKREIEYLNKLTDNATDDDVMFCKIMENHHYEFFEKVAKKIDIDVSLDDIQKWVGDVDPIIFYLKYKFNRPRPYQLANYLNIDLNPIITTDANSSAYPSGHTVDFLVIIYNLIKLKPDAKKELVDLYKKIRNVRQLSGVHYPSDTKCSEILFKKLLQNKII